MSHPIGHRNLPYYIKCYIKGTLKIYFSEAKAKKLFLIFFSNSFRKRKMLNYNIFTHFHFCSNDSVVVVVIITDSDRVHVAGVTNASTYI